MTRISSCFILTFLIALVRGETSVYILSANLEQLVTSSTLQWVSSANFNESMLSNAVVAALQTPDVDNTGEQASGQPVYVCRAKTNYIWVAGQLRPKRRACIVSMYKKVSHHDNFELLVNIENSARLSWFYKDKYTTSLQTGSVTSGEGREVGLRSFVARRATKDHEKPGSLTYHVGKFNPSDNLGVFDVIDQNDMELRFEDGEILVETEPISYELKAVKFDRIRARYNKKPLVLGHTILKNTESGLQRVDTVITYSYNHSIFWGKGHGLLTGLKFTVYLSGGAETGDWALPKTKNVVETETIEMVLEEGTAVNVTLYGNYTESDVPYTSTVIALYKDKEQKSRPLTESKREQRMTDIHIDFGPVYFLHNNSHVPTTTSTTTTTTTTTLATTSRAKSTTHKVMPLDIPQVVQVGNSEKRPDEASAIKIHENSSMMSDASNAEAEIATTTKKDSREPSSSARALADFAVLGVLLMVVRRVT